MERIDYVKITHSIPKDAKILEKAKHINDNIKTDYQKYINDYVEREYTISITDDNIADAYRICILLKIIGGACDFILSTKNMYNAIQYTNVIYLYDVDADDDANKCKIIAKNLIAYYLNKIIR